MRNQSFPIAVNDISCANLNAKHAPLTAFSNMKENGNPLITIFYCKVLKNGGRIPLLPLLSPVAWKMHPRSLGICKMQMIYTTSSLQVPEKKGKASQAGLWGSRHNHLPWKHWTEGYLLCSISQTVANRKFREESITEKGRKAVSSR